MNLSKERRAQYSSALQLALEATQEVYDGLDFEAKTCECCGRNTFLHFDEARLRPQIGAVLNKLRSFIEEIEREEPAGVDEIGDRR